ncbi:MAG: ABC transporter ATP-binding protein [Acidobacteriota bacterium]
MFPIECEGLTRVFGKRTILMDVGFRVRRGTVLGLVGSNGAGKTTLLKILASLVLPTSGMARICGEDPAGNPAAVRSRIGFVPSEERSFYWRLTGRNNLRFFASLQGIHGREGEERVERLLKIVGLSESANTPFREYSTGMKQALGIARGLLHDPPVLLLDEPTRSLSPEAARRICDLLRKKVDDEGKTVVFASHNLTEVARIADEVAILHRGTLRAAGTIGRLAAMAGRENDGDLDGLFTHFTGGDDNL